MESDTPGLILLCMPQGHWIGAASIVPAGWLQGRQLRLEVRINQELQPKRVWVIFTELTPHWLVHTSDGTTKVTIFRPFKAAQLTPKMCAEIVVHLEFRFGWQRTANHRRTGGMLNVSK